jgi:uncharacterized protein
MFLWKYLQPIGKRFIPADTLPRCFIVGMIWGWLPCGLVYSVLLWTLSSADPGMGMLYMFTFGIGTLPSMLLMSVGSNLVVKVAATKNMKIATGLLIIILALASAYVQLGGMHHSSENSEPMNHSHH